MINTILLVSILLIFSWSCLWGIERLRYSFPKIAVIVEIGWIGSLIYLALEKSGILFK